MVNAAFFWLIANTVFLVPEPRRTSDTEVLVFPATVPGLIGEIRRLDIDDLEGVILHGSVCLCTGCGVRVAGLLLSSFVVSEISVGADMTGGVVESLMVFPSLNLVCRLRIVSTRSRTVFFSLMHFLLSSGSAK